MPGVCLQFVIVVFPDHTHLFFFVINCYDCVLVWQSSCYGRQLVAINFMVSLLLCVLMSLPHSTVNSEILARVLFL